MTDEDLERLLRETFADKEKLADNVPQATKRRRPVAPVLLAAAAVLVVLGGILYGVNRSPHPDPAPVAVAPAGDDAEIWGAAIAAITLKFQPEYDVRKVVVLDQSSATATAQRASSPRVFAAAEKDRIAELVVKAAPVEVGWMEPETVTNANCVRELARVSVGEVVDKGDHKEVYTRIAYQCLREYWVTYRVEKQEGAWRVTGTVGVPGGVVPAGGPCPLSKENPAKSPDGC